jgi:hypothetical protein
MLTPRYHRTEATTNRGHHGLPHLEAVVRHGRHMVSFGLSINRIAITGSRSDALDGIRVPAAEIESGVIERVRQFLTNGAAVFEALQHLELDVGRVQQLMRRAQEIADTLINRGCSDIAIALRTLISRSRFNRIKSVCPEGLKFRCTSWAVGRPIMSP